MSFPEILRFLQENVKSATDSCPIYVLFRHNFVYLWPITEDTVIISKLSQRKIEQLSN